MFICVLSLERLFLLVQLKKSGKEPKAGAELVLGETTYKTNVRVTVRSDLHTLINKSFIGGAMLRVHDIYNTI